MDADRTDGPDGWGARGDLARAAAELRETETAARRLSASVRSGLTRAMAEAATGSQSLGGALRGLAMDLARAGLRAAIRPVAEAAAGGAAGLAAGAATALGEAVRGFAGGARGFARGGVVDRPTFFGAGFGAGGGLGVAGEAGPEAILPLARGADGRLGVRGGAPVHVTLNVTTPDAESFRRSGGQVAAELARAVARGRGRL